MSTNEPDIKAKVERYKHLTEQYHALDERIDQLLAAHDGDADQMGDEIHRQYRELAHQRDEIVNEMRHLEQVLFADSE